jgi:hypothetical protein
MTILNEYDYCSYFDRLATIMAQNEDLTVFGFWQRSHPDFAERRVDMMTFNSVEIFAKCCFWLARQPRGKIINRHMSSYGLKERVEHELKIYVPNGLFIAAALACDSDMKRAIDPANPNVYINIDIGRRGKWCVA